VEDIAGVDRVIQPAALHVLAAVETASKIGISQALPVASIYCQFVPNISNPTSMEGTTIAVEAGLCEVIVTELLNQRPSRSPNHAAENNALAVLVKAMAEAPHSVLQKLVDAAVELTGAGSAGVSVLEATAGTRVFRWWATAGAFFPFANTTLPRDFSPCGVVLDRNAPQLMCEPVRFYPYISDLRPEVSEVLLVPFYRGTTPIGTVWVVAHSKEKHFDAEDQRIVTNLSKFASAATLAVRNMEAVEAAKRTLEAEAAERTRALSSQSQRPPTEREGLLRQLENERAKLAAIIEQAPAFICMLRGPQHVFELANERYHEMVGKGDIIGKPVCKAVPEVEGQGFFELLDTVYRTGETFTGNEMPLMLRRSADGSLDRRLVNLVFQALREPDGSVSGIFVHGVDVTDTVLAREALRASEERRRLVLDSAELGSWSVDPATMTLTTDERFRSIFGVSADQIDYEHAVAVIHPEDQGRVREAVAAATRPDEPAPYAVEYRVVHPDGSARWVFAKGRANFSGSGSQRRMVSFDGTLADITDRKQAETERQGLLESERAARADAEKARSEAETANRAKDKFLAVLSHELRTPLTPVAMAAMAMEMDPRLPFEFREDVAMVRRNVELETRLIDDLLDLSRVTSGKLRLNQQPTNVHRLIQHVLETVGPELHEKQLRVERDLKAQSDFVNADPARLQQTLWNLLKNAAKFTPSGGRVVIRTCNEDEWLVVEVADSGKGIDADVLPRIFDPFEQGAADVTQRYGGMGLGLAIAKAVVDLHGGTIRASSDGPGKGATFTVILPLDKAKPLAASAGDSDATQAGQRPIRLLLVEDHADTAKMLMRLLRLDGTDVQWAATVAAAVELASAERFDVVVSDLGLPDGSGHDLIKRLLRDRPVRGIAMSGYGMEDDIRQSREAGFVEHLVKPVSLPQLREAIRRVAAQK
jgi:two-component system CheB/CheR fusion protein